MTRRVVFNAGILPHYREKFHTLVRENLASNGIDYDLFYNAPYGSEAKKGDTIDLPWATRIETRHFGRDGHLVWQKIVPAIQGADLVVLGQENRFLVNYVLQSTPRFLRPRIALWGHGRNFQSRRPDGPGERFKRFWATKADWWFAYTEESRAHIRALGFPDERITVFNNSVDTSHIRELLLACTPQRQAALRDELAIAGKHVGVFVGGIYPDKRMGFLIDAADRIRAQIPDFELIVVGGGPDLPLVQELAASRPWIRVTGPKFGLEKVELMTLGHVFMMPGLMGLAILDAGVAGLAIATTAFPWHSPEIAYLEPEISGVKVADWENPQAYAAAVCALLSDPDRLASMAGAARAMADRYSIETMAGNFATGAMEALKV